MIEKGIEVYVMAIVLRKPSLVFVRIDDFDLVYVIFNLFISGIFCVRTVSGKASKNDDKRNVKKDSAPGFSASHDNSSFRGIREDSIEISARAQPCIYDAGYIAKL